MGFIKGSKIFTDTGWKKIEDISGKDKVLVRNFIGDAEFIQPFALIKYNYDGLINEIGGKNWGFSVTPDHTVVYDRDITAIGKNYIYSPAKDLNTKNSNRIYRKFRFSNPDNYKKEVIKINNQFGRHYSTVSNEDWFTLCAYMLKRGQIDTKNTPTLHLFIKDEHESSILTDILDRIGVEWSLLKRDRYFIRIKNNNNLAQRLMLRLGSSVRKDMYLTDKIIYNSNKYLAKIFFDVLLDKSGQYKCGKKLADSLILFSTLHGYGMTKTLSIKAGTETKKALVKRDIYNIAITKLTASYSATYNIEQHYRGAVYSIDLFDGQVYIKEKIAPVWVNPK
jgi:hypothetical protein